MVFVKRMTNDNMTKVLRNSVKVILRIYTMKFIRGWLALDEYQVFGRIGRLYTFI